MMRHRTRTGPDRQARAGRRGLRALWGSLAVGVALVLSAAPAALGGEWMQASCVNPDGSPAGSTGWISMIAGGGYGSDSSTVCGPAQPMFAILSSDAAVPVGSAETLHYIPPAGSTLDGGVIDVSMFADGRGYDASGTAVAYTPEYAYDASSVFFQCASGLPACANGSYDFTGALAIPDGRGGSLYLSAGCGGAAGASCQEGGSNGAWSLVQLWWANLRLSNSSTPSASDVGGTLLEPAARGSRDLTLTASDPSGPGVLNVSVQADDQTLYNATPDTNSGKCAPVGWSGGAPIFDSEQPCRQSESVDAPIETTALKDGPHTLKVTITDAAQNTSVVYDSTITTHNAPVLVSPPSIQTAGQPLTASALTAEHGEWSTPAAAGPLSYAYQWQECDGQGNACQTIAGAREAGYTPTAAQAGHTLRVLVAAADSDGSTTLASPPSPVISVPTILAAASIPGAANGSRASTAAHLHLAGPTVISRSFARRALRITGQLWDGTGSPIGGATLDVRQQPRGSSTPQLIGHASTAPDGTFTVEVPPGPSRQILIGYRAFSTDAGYSAEAGLREAVAAGVRLRVSPARTSPSGTITLSGRVCDAVPAHGVVVELLVRYRGRWEPLRTPRTDRNGRFAVSYRFQGALGRFPFRAEVFGEQSGFPYDTGQSAAVDVVSG